MFTVQTAIITKYYSETSEQALQSVAVPTHSRSNMINILASPFPSSEAVGA